MAKTLIAYYSRRGQNYVSGKILDLKEGNTEVFVHKLLEQIQADTFHIEAVQPYPEDYDETTRVSREELRSQARPTVRELPESLEGYDTILLGYPNWWGTMPMAVFTFLEHYDLRGKRIIPFCTHEGSGLGRSVADIRRLCPGAEVSEGTAIYGTTVRQADSEVASILAQL